MLPTLPRDQHVPRGLGNLVNDGAARRRSAHMYMLLFYRQEGFEQTAEAVKVRLHDLGSRPLGDVDPVAHKAAQKDLEAFRKDLKSWTVSDDL